MCLCVYVNKHKSQRERNKRNHNTSLSAMQMMHISFVKPFPMLFIRIQSTETLYLICFYKESTCIFVVTRGEGQSLESLWRYPTRKWYIPPVRPFLTNLQAVRSCLRPVRMLHYLHAAVSYFEVDKSLLRPCLIFTKLKPTTYLT